MNADELSSYARLKECHELVADLAPSGEVRQLSAKRLDSLEAYPVDIGLTDTGDSVQTSISLIREALSIEDVGTPLDSVFPRQSEINSLPESPLRQYFLALLSLRGNTGNQGCINALRYLERALASEPANIVYRALYEAIADAIDTKGVKR